MAGFGESKKKRKKVGRPTNLESAFRKMDQGLIDVMMRAADDLPICYQVLHDVLVDPKASTTNRASVAKYLLEFNGKSFEQLLKQLVQDAEEENAETEDSEEEFFKLDFGNNQVNSISDNPTTKQ